MNKPADRYPEANLKPRNKQAALITRKANSLLLYTPPPEQPKITSLSERLAEESKARQARIALLEQEAKERRKRREDRRLAKAKPKQPPKWRHMWAAKFLKRMHKSRGLPPPSQSEILNFRRKQPNFGKPI